METASEVSKNKEVFSGILNENAATALSDIAKKNDISKFSQTLAEFLTMVELQNEGRVPPVQDTSIYNALVRLETAASKTSQWELFGEDMEGPLISISSFESNMLEQSVSMYVTNILGKQQSRALFFPLADFYQADVVVKWKILQKIAAMKVTPHRAIYQQKLENCLKQRIKEEVIHWLETKFNCLKLLGKTTVLKDVEAFVKILIEISSQLETCSAVVRAEIALFNEASCSYFDCVFEALDAKLYPVCEILMDSMDIYQEFYKDYHVNLRDSCALSHVLYLQIRSLVQSVQDLKTPSVSMQIEGYTLLFNSVFMNLLQAMKSECHNRIKRAAEDLTKDVIHTEEKILSSSVIVLTCLCTVMDEAKRMHIEDMDLQITFVLKITEIVSDGAKIYAELLENRLTEKSLRSLELDVAEKACVLANSIYHVHQYLQDFPQKIRKDDISQLFGSKPSQADGKTEISRSLNLMHESMERDLQGATKRVLDFVVSCLNKLTDKTLTAWLQSANSHQLFEKWFVPFTINLEFIEQNFKDNLAPKFLSLVRNSTWTRIRNGFKEGCSLEEAKALKELVEEINEYYCTLKIDDDDIHKDLYQWIVSNLELNSKTTIELELDYYSNIAESLVSPVEYLGHIAFQAGYKVVGKNLVDLHMNVQKGQRLPAKKFDLTELHVKLELCPTTMFPNIVPLKSKPATEDLDNPVFNEQFVFSSLPSSALSVKGAVVHVLILNQSRTFSASAVLLLKQVQNMSGFVSMEFLPVYLMPLKKFDLSQVSYQVLESRSRWDKNAKRFIKRRLKLEKQPRTFLMSCIR